MSETHAHPPVHTEEHPEHHEASDVHIRPLVHFVIWGFIVVVAIHFFLWWTFNVYLKAPEQAGNIHEVVPSVAGDTAFFKANETPDPRLQGIPGGPGLRGGPEVKDFHKNTPRQDTQEMKANAAEQLSTLGDSYDPGFKRIPIESAMRLAVERRLIQPRVASAAHPTTLPATQPKGGAGVAR